MGFKTAIPPLSGTVVNVFTYENEKPYGVRRA